MAVVIFCVVVTGCLANGYAGAQAYNDDALFLYAGGTLRGVKVDVWSFPGREVAIVAGRNIGPLRTRVGLSVDTNSNITHTNIVGQLKRNFYSIKVDSYNLYQNGHGSIKDVLLSHNTFSLVTGKDGEKDKFFPVGIVWRNIRFYSLNRERMQVFSFIGLYIELGVSTVYIAGDLVERESLWMCLGIDF